jgi:glycine/D-amino acid oxidase-like deaminating enzyme
MRNLVPKLGKETHRWSGQVMNPVDFMAFTGRNPGNEHVYVHTGDSGQGITLQVQTTRFRRRAITSGSRFFHPLAPEPKRAHPTPMQSRQEGR